MKLWKIKRELHRSWLHVCMFFEAMLGQHQRSRYDQRKDDLISVSQGAQMMQARVAVFLLYQPRGILSSTLQTCRHLTRNGFAVVVVSNAPLSGSDRTCLLAETYQVIERPNFGYDFGGYRDGILHVLHINLYPKTLLVLNDSVWFPLRTDCDFLDRVKSQTADVYGPVYSKGHLQSYMYAFQGDLVQSAFFRDLWQNLYMSNNKAAVVRRCEMRISADIKAAGFTMSWFLSSEDVLKALRRLPDDELAEVIRHDQQSDNSLSRAFVGFQHDIPGWAEQALELYSSTLDQRYIMKDHPLILTRDLHLPLLKKDRAPQYALQRRALISSRLLLAALDETVAEEIIHWDAGK